MESKFIPQVDALKNTDWRKPEVDKNDKKKLLLLVFCVAMFAVVFIPWFCLGVKVDEVGSVKLRAFGFQTWYGVVAGVVALVGVLGALYKHYSLTLCSAVLGLLLSFFALTDYPTSRLAVNVDGEFEEGLELAKKGADFDDFENLGGVDDPFTLLAMYDELPNFKVPGQLVEVAAVMFDLVDQRFVYKALEKVGFEEQLGDTDVRILNNRLGAVLYLVFSAVVALLAYAAITGLSCCCCKKEACPAPVEEAPKAE